MNWKNSEQGCHNFSMGLPQADYVVFNWEHFDTVVDQFLQIVIGKK